MSTHRLPAATAAAAIVVGALVIGGVLYLGRSRHRGPPRDDRAVAILLDNGSLRAASVLSLRGLAAAVAVQTGSVAVVPASARMSDRVPPADLGGGAPAELLDGAVARLYGAGARRFVVLPAFLGPSDTVTKDVPAAFHALAASRPGLALAAVAAPAVVVGDGDDRVPRALADAVRATAAAAGVAHPPAVIVCDHGSPTPAVTDVRDAVAAGVRAALGGAAARVAAASMERRAGAAYDFNEPTLDKLLRTDGFNDGDVIVAMMFISPGRHAGEGGDVATIIAGAEADAAAAGRRLRATMTPLLGAHPLFVDVLADRLREALAVEGGGKEL
jgi:sirohydrochlorin ferrochelatase